MDLLRTLEVVNVQAITFFPPFFPRFITNPEMCCSSSKGHWRVVSKWGNFLLTYLMQLQPGDKTLISIHFNIEAIAFF